VPACRGVALKFGDYGCKAVWGEAKSAARIRHPEFAKELPGSLGVPGYTYGF
jgi:hypothetical protein